MRKKKLNIPASLTCLPAKKSRTVLQNFRENGLLYTRPVKEKLHMKFQIQIFQKHIHVSMCITHTYNSAIAFDAIYENVLFYST